MQKLTILSARSLGCIFVTSAFAGKELCDVDEAAKSVELYGVFEQSEGRRVGVQFD
jgi:hypothetical protein